MVQGILKFTSKVGKSVDGDGVAHSELSPARFSTRSGMLLGLRERASGMVL